MSLVHFRAQGSKCDIPVIPPVSYTRPSQDSCTTQINGVDPGKNESATNINSNVNDRRTEITAQSEDSDECNETLSKIMNNAELTEQVVPELSSSLDKNETLPILQCPSKDDTAYNEEPDDTEQDATERCSPGNSRIN